MKNRDKSETRSRVVTDWTRLGVGGNPALSIPAILA